jgi:superfamily I DNA and/or RNA helicase
MFNALRQALAVDERTPGGRLIRILTGEKPPTFRPEGTTSGTSPDLNPSQQAAIDKILSANELAIVHGPPGTGKTTTLVQAIKALIGLEGGPILAVAPSNTAVDLLSERLSDEGLNVLRVGNPARVSERLMSLTLDSRMTEHTAMREIKKMKKQAAAFRDMAHKYKRNFGRAEREQRKALFDEAHKIMKDVERTEQYILDDLLTRAQVITATLVGANHYTVRSLSYHTVVIDEAGQAAEPACWIPILKAQKLVLAGDHCQLPPTIKSEEAAGKGLNVTLLEKCAALYPQAVVLLEEQYRMHEMIMGYSAAVFYQRKLKAHASVADHRLFPADRPMVFVDTAGCGFEEKTDGVSTSNPEEAAFLFKHLTQFTHELTANTADSGDLPRVAVISPYRQQVELLKEQLLHSPLLQTYGDRLSVNTIDSFQGQERDVVYISMTRSNPESKIGFLSDIRRMNVAMTRARKKLVIVGDSATLSQSSFYAGLIRYAEEQDAYQSAWELVDS